MLRSEGRDTLKLELLVGRTERVTDGENTRIENADDISGISLVNDLTAPQPSAAAAGSDGSSCRPEHG